MITAAHLQEAPVVLTGLAGEDLIDRRLNVVHENWLVKTDEGYID